MPTRHELVHRISELQFTPAHRSCKNYLKASHALSRCPRQGAGLVSRSTTPLLDAVRVRPRIFSMQCVSYLLPVAHADGCHLLAMRIP